MLLQTLNFKVNGVLSCMAVANAEGINLIRCDMDGNLDVGGNELDHLPFSLGEVTGDFAMDHNHITQLVGAPNWVGGSFYCRSNRLESLIGCPQLVGANFCCDGNQLTSLAHAPQVILGILSCADNKLTSFEGFPEHIGDTMNISNNPISSLRKIHFHIKACKRILLGSCNIAGGLLDLFNIERLEEVLVNDNARLTEAVCIVNKHLGSGGVSTASKLKCKAELERNSLGDFI